MKKLMTSCLLLFTLVALSANTTTDDTYQYRVDLSNIQDDKVQVALTTPQITKNKINFYFPKIVPGTYSIYDFGRFITEFKALDQAGQPLIVERKDINTFRISDAKKLHTITYKVDDTFDATSGTPVYGMSGTSIDKDRGVVLNGHGFFGYFEDMKDRSFSIEITKPTDYYGATGMKAISSNASKDVFEAINYNYLVDMPLLYAKPDTATLKVGNAEVLIAIDSPSGVVTSAYVASNFAELLKAEKAYMGGTLPVSKYAFLMHFLSPGQQVGTGALEHNYSSLYVLPDVPQEQWIQPLMDIAAHEFFHIITPLNVHSEHIHYFDFNDPKMSQHLWMYEGVTEYFSHHAQLVGGLTNLEHFMGQMAQKVDNNLQTYTDQLPFTKMSRYCLDRYSSEYGNVYEKGALIGLCLDVLLRKHTNGKMGLMDLMNQLMTTYGKDRPFKDKKLFKDIASLSHPEIKTFFKRYVAGAASLPLGEILAEIGLNYKAPQAFMDYTYGNISLGYNQDAGRVIITSTGNLNEFGKKMGYKDGDEILRINGEAFPEQAPFSLFSKQKANFKEGELLVLDIVRKDDTGKEQNIQLSAPIQKVSMPGQASIEAMSQLTDAQKQLRKQWLQGATKN
ncbi:MAG: peptidase M61 [Saprospiraceae bacterium]|nr:MAG: peptidase M61 [Saprospiraceae bacterium]